MTGQLASNRPPFETFKGATCRGSYILGSACGHCERCAWERNRMESQTSVPTDATAARAKDCKYSEKWYALGSGVTALDIARQLAAILSQEGTK